MSFHPKQLLLTVLGAGGPSTAYMKASKWNSTFDITRLSEMQNPAWLDQGLQG